MDNLEIAELKDSILRYFLENDIKETLLSNVYVELKPQNITRDVVHDCMEDMTLDKVLHRFAITGARALYSITDQGKRKLREGGYKKQLEIELEKAEHINELDQKYREKTDLEIANLNASLKHYRHTRRISIWAIVISVISIISSIFIWLISFLLSPRP